MRIRLRKIMCATDFSDYSNHAIRYGVALAREFKAKLYLCHVVDLPSVGMYGEAMPDPAEQQDRILSYVLDQLKGVAKANSIDWEPLVSVGHAASEISRMAEEKGVDLVISATHGRSGLKRLILGSVTSRLMRTLPCPLLVVRTIEHDFVTPPSQEIRLQRILVGCDFSADSHLAFQYGLSLAQEFQSELHLVHVIAPPAYKDLLKLAAEQELHQDQRDLLNQNLANMVPEEARNWCTPKMSLLAGQPHEELTKYAVINNIDLIIMGARGLGLVETLFIGSTTDRVVPRAPCPVLAIRQKGQTS